MNTQKNHFDLKCMMIVDCWWYFRNSKFILLYSWNGEQGMKMFEGSKNLNIKGETPERHLPHKKEEDCEYPRWSIFAVNSANLGDVKIDGHHVSASKVPVQPTADCTWIMDGSMVDQGEGEKGL